ncbi:ead/Ea22-like family protein [Enterobacter asburiae]|uniref:ead/Ea22-like family protein n=1 Tax=Enterobacter asburiae TaxID=61645 RepID=UPI002075BFD6|nr:ead/Ea22-like family protein [Enterobacter asburiae]MCM7771014.1 ead/Ea22-like family protein [Enterobacter asburiae]
MSNIDKQALEKAAEKALQGKWDYEAGAIWNTDESGMVQHMAAVEAGDDISDEEHKSNMRFITLATPAVVLGLLDELYESKAAEANESSCANSVIDSAIKWQTRAKDAEAKLEAAEKKTVEMPTFDGYVPHVARELQAAFRIACDNAGINIAAAGKGERNG